VEAQRGKKAGAAALTRLLEERVQALLDDRPPSVDATLNQSEVA